MTKYQEYIERKRREYKDKFDDSDLNRDFIPYFNSRERIVVNNGYEEVRGTIGITTGWKPAFLLMGRKSDLGSTNVIGPKDKIVGVVGKNSKVTKVKKHKRKNG